MASLTEQLQRLGLGGTEVKSLTGWDQAMVNDYLGIQEGILLLAKTVQELTRSGYGGGVQFADIPFAIGAGAVTLPIDTVLPIQPKNVTVDLVGSTIAVNVAGVWRISYGLSMSGISVSGSTRVYFVGLFNITKGVFISNTEAVPLPPNVTDNAYSTSGLFDIPEADVGDLLEVQVGFGSVISGTLVSGHLQANMVSELGDTLLP